MRILPLIIFFITTSAGAAGLDISFYGTPPTFPPDSRLTVAAGVNPGIPVVFDLSEPGRVVLRPAEQGETSTEAQPLFKFEWQKDKSARFYRLVQPKLLADLSAQNAIDTKTTEGADFEQKVLQQYLREGEVLRNCLPPSKPFRGSLSIFILVSATGKLDRALVLPEGSVAECILDQGEEATFDPPPGARLFTVKEDIHVTP